MLDLTQPGSLKLLSERIAQDIDAACVAENNTGPRSHLGASEIGDPCERKLWLKFRWCFNKVHDGRQYRLFNRGHFEEPRFAHYLETIGFTVTEFAEGTEHETDKGKRQIRIGAAEGHFGGSTDGIGTHPNYGKFLLEYKTQGYKKFPKLVEKGCQSEKYQHFCQQSIYGYKLGLEYSIYMVVNKDNDDLYIEVLKLDWELGKQLEAKAERIIFATEPPPKLSCNIKSFECNYCDFKEVCYQKIVLTRTAVRVK